MDELRISDLKVDRRAIVVSSDFEDAEEKAYWLSRTPQERLRQVEVLRRINCGYKAITGLQRVLELVKY